MDEVKKVELTIETLTNKKRVSEKYILTLKEANNVLKDTYLGSLMGDSKIRRLSRETITNNIVEIEKLIKELKEIQQELVEQHRLKQQRYEEYKANLLNEQKEEADRWLNR